LLLVLVAVLIIAGLVMLALWATGNLGVADCSSSQPTPPPPP
jgi:hypothetical protein